jgi:FkbM family methyltransferase
MRAALDHAGAVKHGLLSLLPWVTQTWATHRATGLRYRVSTRDVVGRTILRRTAYEPQLTQWLVSGFEREPGGVFVDVGANLGWFTLQAAHLAQVRRVVAVEPDVVNHGLLQANIQANGLGARVDAVACALGSGPGLARLHRYKGSNLGRHSLVVDHGNGGSWVPLESLDVLLERLGLSEAPIAAIKIDVEGYEPRVLAGAQAALRRTRALLVELSPELSRAGGLDLGAALSAIAAAGFTPDVWDRQGEVPDFAGLRVYPHQATVGFRRVRP